MGEIADLIINGDLCEECGVCLGDGDGFPRKCHSCRTSDNAIKFPKVKCPTCGKRVKVAGLPDHMKDAHGVPLKGA